MEAFVSRQDTLREISSVGVQIACNSVGVCARAKSTDVQFIQLSNVLQEGLGVWPEFGVIPRGMRPQLEMVSILTECTNTQRESTVNRQRRN